MKNSLWMKMNCALVFLTILNKEKIKKITTSLPLVKMLVKVTLAVLWFAQLTTKQFWLELYHTEVDVVKQENQEYTERSITLQIGFGQVNLFLFGPKKNKNILVLREPTFVVIANPLQKYQPIQMNFLGKKHSQTPLIFRDINF